MPRPIIVTGHEEPGGAENQPAEREAGRSMPKRRINAKTSRSQPAVSQTRAAARKKGMIGEEGGQGSGGRSPNNPTRQP